MGTVLKIVGGLWALIGFGDIVMSFAATSSTGILTFGLIFNGFIFVIPGLAIFGIGAALAKRSSATPAPIHTGAANEKTCPKCAEKIKAAALLCRFCGNTFPAPTPP